MLKHVRWWKFGDSSKGTVAIKINDNDKIVLKAISGQALPATLLLPVLNSSLQKGWMEETENLHQSRRYPWLVQRRVGMSGSVDYFLRSLQDEEYLNQPITACLHVSMYDKLNEGLNLWLGDLPPLLAYMVEDYPPPPKGEYSIEVYTPTERDGWQKPKANSGLQETIKNLQAMEVLSE